MNFSSWLTALAVALIVIISGLIVVTPYVFAGRSLPGLTLGGLSLAGIPHDDLRHILSAYEADLLTKEVNVALFNDTKVISLADLGVSLDTDATLAAIAGATLRDVIYSGHEVTPRLSVDTSRLTMSISRHFPGTLNPPQNASLTLTGSQPLTLVPAQDGETIDAINLRQQLENTLRTQDFGQPLALKIVSAGPAVENTEVESARQFAGSLLQESVSFIYEPDSFTLPGSTLRRLLVFAEIDDPKNTSNKILGVALDSAGLASYLQNTLVPVINQEARDARFTLTEDGNSTARVTQFALPQQGRTLDIERTISHAAASLAQGSRQIPLAVDVVSPAIAASADIEQLGLTALLAIGESDFAGSPNNRVTNIKVGADKYHGLLIAPGAEFSFNEFLGPVDAAHGFLPELVIKNNVTTPEYGGGLCQVSTTVFRAALNAGLEITNRRNHAYAVRYYGTPGLDATIYPPYTDLTFANNTPGYILIQTRIEGTKLLFEFWGTDDGREVTLAAPVLYDQQPDGAVKAYVEQTVVRAGETIIDETFHSRYKSPKLFPKVLSANGEDT